MPGCMVSVTTASFCSVEYRRRRATPVITSSLENLSDIDVCLGLSLGPPANAGVRSKRGAVQVASLKAAAPDRIPAAVLFREIKERGYEGGAVVGSKRRPKPHGPGRKALCRASYRP